MTRRGSSRCGVELDHAELELPRRRRLDSAHGHPRASHRGRRAPRRPLRPRAPSTSRLHQRRHPAPARARASRAGVWSFVVQPPAGLGGSSITLGATFDGEPIVVPKRVLIATDVWSAEYATTASGGCAIGSRSSSASDLSTTRTALWLFVVACASSLRRRKCPAPRASESRDARA